MEQEGTEQVPCEVGEGDLVGNREAAQYLRMKRKTLTSYIARGLGPTRKGRCIRNQYVLPVYERGELDKWAASRPKSNKSRSRENRQ